MLSAAGSNPHWCFFVWRFAWSNLEVVAGSWLLLPSPAFLSWVRGEWDLTCVGTGPELCCLPGALCGNPCLWQTRWKMKTQVGQEPGWPSACPGIRHSSSCSWAAFLTSYSLTRGIWAQGGISRPERSCLRTGGLSNFSGVFGDCLCCQLSHESSKSILVTSGEQTCNFSSVFRDWMVKW